VITTGSTTTGWPGATNGPPFSNFRATLADPTLTQFEIVLVTASSHGGGLVTIQRAVEPCNNGVQTAFDFPPGSTMSPTGTAAGYYPGSSPANPVWLAPVAWCYVNLPVAGFTIDPYTYANGSSGVGATATQTTPADGALTINGGTPSIGDRVALCDLVVIRHGYDGYLYCGIYTVTALGDGATVPWVLTRATDNDTAATLGTFWAVSVEQGSDTLFGGSAVSVGYVDTTAFTVGSTDVQPQLAGASLAGLAYNPLGLTGPIALESGSVATEGGLSIGGYALARSAIAIGGTVTASNGIAIGIATASGPAGIAIGLGNASGSYSTIIGINVFAAGNGGIAVGGSSSGWGPWYWAMASGCYAVPGDSQYALWVPYNQTTDATPTALGVNVSGSFTGPPNVLALTFPDFVHTFRMEATVVARRTDVPGTVSVWECNNIVVDGDGVSAYRTVGTPTTTVVQQDAAASGWAVAFSLTGAAFAVTVTGEVGNTIQWTCTLKLYEVAG
jgi:hypothetical protein